MPDRVTTEAAASTLSRLVVKNRGGSVEHYFHFLLGFCVPLVQFHLSGRRPDHLVPLAVRDCGPLTPLIAELELNLRPQPREEFCRAGDSDQLQALEGYDSIDRYDAGVFEEFSTYVGSLTSKSTQGREQGAVVLIERGPAEAYYASKRAEIAGAGTDRRAIANHDELKSALAQESPHFENVRLEGRRLVEQFEIFQAADILIAQHGAALANIVFMRKDSRVIEILPRGGEPWKVDLFRTLARTVGIGYSVVEQAGPFSLVNARAVLDAVSGVS